MQDAEWQISTNPLDSVSESNVVENAGGGSGRLGLLRSRGKEKGKGGGAKDSGPKGSKGKQSAAPKWSFSNPFTGFAAVQAAAGAETKIPAAGSGPVAVVSGGVAYRIT